MVFPSNRTKPAAKNIMANASVSAVVLKSFGSLRGGSLEDDRHVMHAFEDPIAEDISEVDGFAAAIGSPHGFAEGMRKAR